MEKNEKCKRMKNIYYTLGANILTFLMGIVTGFIIPKFLGVEDFGYIKLFTFYTTYIGITHFGFLDGIYIKYGAYEYEDIPKEKFRGYFRYLVSLQIIEAIIIVGIFQLMNLDGNRYFIVLLVIFNMIIMNITTLFAFIHQFTKRFKIFSVNIVLNKFIYVAGSLIFIYLNMLGYKEFIILQTIINIVILLIYIYINKDLVWGKSEKVSENLKEYINLTKSGFFIMIGNFMGVVILGLDKMFVDTFFTLKDFSMYSFSYTLISLFFILLNSLTTVIYPYLARMKSENAAEVYSKIRIGLTVLMSSTLVGYFGIEWIVSIYLPEYKESLKILVFLVPTIIYSSQINILVANYYKILKETKGYTKNNLVALILGVTTNIVAYSCFKSVIAIAAATLISFVLWLLYSDIYFAKKINVSYKKAMSLEVIVVSLFIFSVGFENTFISASVYIIILTSVLIIFYSKDIKNCILSLKSN
ncbi:MAG: lipopolysaccharide biosynthesis protein [Sarcina sp.]